MDNNFELKKELEEIKEKLNEIHEQAKLSDKNSDAWNLINLGFWCLTISVALYAVYFTYSSLSVLLASFVYVFAGIGFMCYVFKKKKELQK